jgi:hypothetical protein
VMPRLMEAHLGSAAPQSQHLSLPEENPGLNVTIAISSIFGQY